MPETLREPEESSAKAATLHAPDYIRLARASLPRWLQIVGSTPWFLGGKRQIAASLRSPYLLYKEQAATLAIAMLSELDPHRQDRSYLREIVRASLTRWQLLLGVDGQPVHRRLRGSPLHSAIVLNVVQLLSETAGFQTEMLLDDVERHIRWVARRRQQTPWLEASAVCAMADGAVIVRNTTLLAQARKRLSTLLGRQDEEGWFPERGGPDIGRLSLTTDALARLYRQNGWEELTEPLERALRFLIHFVHPDGSAGGCYNSCDTAFVSPYGVELLANTFEEANALASFTRRQCAYVEKHRMNSWPEDVCAVWGAGLMLAAANTTPRTKADHSYPFEVTGQKHFPHAGLTVFATPAYHAVTSERKGGAVRVVWKSGAADLDDFGVTVVYPNRMRTSARPDTRTMERVADRSISCSGVLRPVEPASERSWRWFKRFLWRLGLRRKGDFASSQAKEGRPSRIDYKRLTHDRYDREITFGEDWIQIRDRVYCRLPCRAVVCQSPPPVRVKPFGDSSALQTNARTPIFVDGGRTVEVTRLYRDGELVGRH